MEGKELHIFFKNFLIIVGITIAVLVCIKILNPYIIIDKVSDIEKIVDSVKYSNTDKYVDEKGVIYSGDKKTLEFVGSMELKDNLKEYEIPEGVEIIGANAFGFCSNLRKIKLPSTLKEIGSWSFESCSLLTKIIIPQSVTKIRMNPFCGIPKINVIINDNDNYYIKKDCLMEAKTCKLISYVGDDIIVNLESENYIHIIGEYAFKSNNTMEHLRLPKTVVEIGDHAFQYCESLNWIKIYLESLKVVGLNPFEGDNKIVFSTTKNNNLTLKYDDKSNIFFIDAFNRRLISYYGDHKNPVIYDGSPKIEFIDRSAFWGCNHIDKLDIRSELVRRIETETFFYSDIDTVILTDYVDTIDSKAFNPKTKIGVPKGKKQKYEKMIPDSSIFEVELSKM